MGWHRPDSDVLVELHKQGLRRRFCSSDAGDKLCISLVQSVLYGEFENQFNKPLVEMVVGLRILQGLNSLQVLIS